MMRFTYRDVGTVGCAELVKRIDRVVPRQMRFAYRDVGEGREQDAEASFYSAHPTANDKRISRLSNVNYPISPGSTVTLHLSLTLEEGTVAESTFDDEPLTFTLGDGTLVEGLELGLYGLKAGATQRLVLEPQQAFGLHDPDKLHRLGREEFPAELQLQPGVIIGFDTPSGEELSGTLVSLTDETVVVDFNHPLAGRVVVFEVEIIAVEPAPQ